MLELGDDTALGLGVPIERIRPAQGRTLVAVLHDLNQAARYATHLVVMREGRVVAAA